MLFDKITNKHVITFIVSAIVGASIGYVVSNYTYRGSEMQRQAIVYEVTSRNRMLEDKINMLTNRVEMLEKEINQNRILIQSLDSNVQLQMDLIKKTLSPKEGKK